MRKFLIAAFGLATLLAGCKNPSAVPPPGSLFAVRGQLVEGVECPVLVTANGHRYTISGSLGSFKVGDQVCVRGRIAAADYCMAGEATINLEAIGPHDNCP